MHKIAPNEMEAAFKRVEEMRMVEREGKRICLMRRDDDDAAMFCES